MSGHLGLALGRSWDILGLSWAALRLSWVVLGYLAAVIQVFGPTERNELMESLVQLGEVFGDSSVWTFRRDRPNPTMLKKCKNRDWTNLAKAWQKLADSGEAESRRLEPQGGGRFSHHLGVSGLWAAGSKQARKQNNE